MNRIQAAADFLSGLRRGRKLIPHLPPEIAPRSLDEGYQIQRAFVERLLTWHGGRTCGFKIACTSQIAQQTLNVATPLFGQLLDATSYPSGISLPASDFLVRCMEVEFAFLLADDVAGDQQYTPDTIAAYVAAVIPALEIVDHRFEDWQKVGAPTLAADNAIHGAWVHGKPVFNWQKLNLSAVATALIINGHQRLTGSGSAVLGHPLAALAWLANTLPRYNLSLRRGDYVLTGLTTAIYLARPTDHLRGELGPLGYVEVTFSC
jgi:2-keto-4-pentenoate hydratase